MAQSAEAAAAIAAAKAAAKAAEAKAEAKGVAADDTPAAEVGAEGEESKSKLQRPATAVADPMLVREYVRQVVSGEVTAAATGVLSELHRLQERAHLKDAVKAAMRKRYVCGLREVVRSLKTNKAKALIIAHNIEQIDGPDGLDQAMAQIIQV